LIDHFYERDLSYNLTYYNITDCKLLQQFTTDTQDLACTCWSMHACMCDWSKRPWQDPYTYNYI